MVFIQEPKKGQLTITIPKNIIRMMDWKKGIELIVMPSNGDVTLREVKKKK